MGLQVGGEDTDTEVHRASAASCTRAVGSG